jgi:hypothetical protein
MTPLDTIPIASHTEVTQQEKHQVNYYKVKDNQESLYTSANFVGRAQLRIWSKTVPVMARSATWLQDLCSRLLNLGLARFCVLMQMYGAQRASKIAVIKNFVQTCAGVNCRSGESVHTSSQ